MARYIADLTELASSTFASGDFVEVWHAAGGSNRSKKLRLDRFAMLATNNVFAGSINLDNFVSINSFDNGGNRGPIVEIGRNNNGSTPSPGFIRLIRADNGNAPIWVDNGGLVRVHTVSNITNATMTAGTVVGAQTSSLDSKDIIGEPEIDSLWDRIALGAAAVRRFVYKSSLGWDNEGNEIVGARPYSGEDFSGVVVDYAPCYGMDRDAAHPAGKSLNEINILGDLLLAVSQLGARVAALEAK
jgi:hypothetical protein